MQIAVLLAIKKACNMQALLLRRINTSNDNPHQRT